MTVAVRSTKAYGKLANAVNGLTPRGRFALFLSVALIITIGLTVLSYTLYVVSGTAQLDLSRPGYKQALSEVTPAGADDTYSSTGALDRDALKEFKQKYDELLGKTKGYSAFDPNALSDEQLNLAGSGDSGAIGPQ